MTTINEYKSMMEGATDAPWVVIYDEDISTYIVKSDEWNICDICSCINEDNSGERHANLIASSINLTPELIRVIELAEDAIMNAMEVGLNAFCEDDSIKAWDKANEALSEIRKLRGE